MITDRHVELYRLVEIVGVSMAEAGRIIEPPESRQRVSQLLAEVYAEKPNLRPRNKGKRRVVAYDSSMDGDVALKF